jgi:formylglycine-generating enzyme required for sulfatase activity
MITVVAFCGCSEGDLAGSAAPGPAPVAAQTAASQSPLPTTSTEDARPTLPQTPETPAVSRSPEPGETDPVVAEVCRGIATIKAELSGGRWGGNYGIGIYFPRKISSENLDAAYDLLKERLSGVDAGAIHAALLGQLQEPDPVVRWKALCLLGHFGYRDVERLRQFCAKEQDRAVRAAAMDVARKLPAPDGAELLAHIASNDPDEYLRQDALKQFTSTHTKEHWRSIVPALKSKGEDIRKDVGRYLASEAPVESIGPLLDAYEAVEIDKYLLKRCIQAQAKRFGTKAVQTVISGYTDGVVRRLAEKMVPNPPTKVAVRPTTMPNGRPGHILDLGNDITITLVRIDPGRFIMGSPPDEKGRSDVEAQHEVTISKTFYMGVTEVTQEQYETIMGENPSRVDGENRPVENMKWDDAAEYCKRLSALTSRTIRLPTEAEWEYACRAGSTGPFAGKPDDMGWYSGNSDGTTHRVGRKQPNAWGLYDMHGNVAELCADWYGPYPKGAVVDPKGPESGKNRARRGGGPSTRSEQCRAASRYPFWGASEGDGFRLVLELR